MVDVVDAPGVVNDLLPAQGQLVTHTVRKALRLRQAETRRTEYHIRYSTVPIAYGTVN